MEMQGIPGDRNKNALLLGRDGYVTKFINGPGKPFIKRTLRKGYQAAVLDGKSISFDPYFFKFLTRGIRAGKPMKPNYTVNISGMPTSANDESQFQPHATVLELVCSDKTTTLENLNFPVRKTFRWSPTSECDTIFTIKIGSLDLVTRYEGSLSFPKFLKAFPNGHHTFTPADFLDHRQDLKRMGVKAIRVRYQMKGNRTVAGLVSATPGRVPGEIVTCWK
jgi:type VI secretion system protein ImpL